MVMYVVDTVRGGGCGGGGSAGGVKWKEEEVEVGALVHYHVLGNEMN